MKKQPYKEIGIFIKQLREQKGISQEEFAQSLNTSQSAIARMEKGEQNFSTEMLAKISEVLNRPILKLAGPSVDFEIEGGHKLSGSIETNTSKNGAMGLLCAALLNKGKTTLHGIPRIEEVNRILEIFASIGISFKWIEKRSLEIIPPKMLDLSSINAVSAHKTRTIIMFLAPLIHLFKEFKLPNAQGCKLGKRTIAAHIYGMEKLGVNINVTEDLYVVNSTKLHPDEIIMYESGDTATENLIMLAAKIPGVTIIKYASANYMVQEVCFFLERLGVKIEGIGTTTLKIHGVEEINQNVEYHNSEDPTESMMFLSAAILTKSQITITRCPIEFLEVELMKLEVMGFKYKKSKVYKSKNGKTNLVDITTFPSKLTALDEKITTWPYPSLNMDNLPFFAVIATQVKGTTLIHDWVYETRAIYYMELNRLGANLTLADPHRVFVNGVTPLQAAQIVCPPALRPATILMVGMLGAEGISILRNVYSIERGYEEVAERLNSIGAKIKILNDRMAHSDNTYSGK
jgi:UDP-N-acetylglucosamine 1-carboxyvinyltransferase